MRPTLGSYDLKEGETEHNKSLATFHRVGWMKCGEGGRKEDAVGVGRRHIRADRLYATCRPSSEKCHKRQVCEQ